MPPSDTHVAGAVGVGLEQADDRGVVEDEVVRLMPDNFYLGDPILLVHTATLGVQRTFVGFHAVATQGLGSVVVRLRLFVCTKAVDLVDGITVSKRHNKYLL
jgi:hypothetical protein